MNKKIVEARECLRELKNFPEWVDNAVRLVWASLKLIKVPLGQKQDFKDYAGAVKKNYQVFSNGLFN